MSQFDYKAIDPNGRFINGSSESTSLDSLVDQLHEQGLFLVQGRARRPRTAAVIPASIAPRAAPAPAAPLKRRGKVHLKEIAVFTSQLSVMVRTALPLLEALDVLARQKSSAALRAVLVEVATAVRTGKPLSEAFGSHPEIFDEVYLSLLSAGESSGKLTTMLERLSDHLQFKVRLAEKVRSALIYPAIVVTAAVAVVAFLALYVLPTFIDVFNQFELVLPLATRLLLGASQAARAGWLYILVASIATAWWARRWARSPAHARLLQIHQINMPILGELLRNISMTRSFRTLAALIEAGIPILRALKLAQASAGNAVFHELFEKIYNSAQEGRGLAVALADSPHVPDYVVNLVDTGEKTGTLPEVLGRIADMYEAETDAAVKNLISALEPIFIVGLGLAVGAMAVAVFMPMFDLAQGIK